MNVDSRSPNRGAFVSGAPIPAGNTRQRAVVDLLDHESAPTPCGGYNTMGQNRGMDWRAFSKERTRRGFLVISDVVLTQPS